jgi:hypothetical protein
MRVKTLLGLGAQGAGMACYTSVTPVRLSIVARLFLDCSSIVRSFLPFHRGGALRAATASALRPWPFLTVWVRPLRTRIRILHFTFASRCEVRLNAARASAPLIRR